jgi:hypothetical protein
MVTVGPAIPSSASSTAAVSGASSSRKRHSTRVASSCLSIEPHSAARGRMGNDGGGSAEPNACFRAIGARRELASMRGV